MVLVRVKEVLSEFKLVLYISCTIVDSTLQRGTMSTFLTF